MAFFHTTILIESENNITVKKFNFFVCEKVAKIRIILKLNNERNCFNGNFPFLFTFHLPVTAI